jgi:predicted O-methyltransferase YrrM
LKITAITTACNRPEAWKLSEAYMRRQTRQPDQWLVIDDDDPPTVCTMGQDYIYDPTCRDPKVSSLIMKLRLAFRSNLIKGDMVVFWENDDWYAPDWIETCEKELATNNVTLFGEGRAIYYNVKDRWWYEHENMQHCSLCSTAIRSENFTLLSSLLEDPNPFVDARLWERARSNRRKIIDPLGRGGKRQVIGIKAMPGRQGYGGGHNERDRSSHPDNEMQKLISLIRTDYTLYEEFYRGYKRPQTKVAWHTETGRVHGPNWSNWLSHLVDKPGATGLEIGTFKGDSAEWMLENIFTGEGATYYCVDPFTGSIEHKIDGQDCSTLEKETRERLSKFGDKAEIIVGPSENVVRTYGFYDLDFVYVDGSHTARDAMRDAVLAFDCLKVGGIMVWDDYEWSVMKDPLDCPKVGVNAFLSAYAKQIEILAPRGWQIAIKKTAP